MKNNRRPFAGPYFDPTGLGFGLVLRHHDGAPCRQQLTITTICWNCAEDRALFVNAAGLVVPSEHDRYELAELLRTRTAELQYGAVVGDGQFAMKPTERNALASSGRIRQWVLYRLEQPAPYLDDEAAWAAWLETELDAERKAAAKSQLAEQGLQRSFSQRGVELPWSGVAGTGEADQETCEHQSVETRRAALTAVRAKSLAEDVRIAAWLRGDVGDPPLLALMKGAA